MPRPPPGPCPDRRHLGAEPLDCAPGPGPPRDATPVVAGPADRAAGPRYEKSRPGELIHADVKKLGRIPASGGWFAHGRAARPSTNRSGPGYEFVRCAIDDHTRLAYAKIHPDERVETCAGPRLVGRPRHRPDRGGHDRQRLRLPSRPRLAPSAHRPGRHRCLHAPVSTQTNGKAECFNRALLEEWAYSQPFTSASHRADALQTWPHTYNHHRTHTAIGGQPPIHRVNNLPGHYS
ncbi:integrase core domain-containing protein [Phycicoccus sp. SLBN-51]|uniref:integrase core domain-containing protein n=1 Tax=Phycicoccus sp. SLBN-51 TaxID=2768447 RepID=UPI00336A5D46